MLKLLALLNTLHCSAMGPCNNGDVTDEELGRLACHIDISDLEQIAVQFLGLVKTQVASCRYNAHHNSGSDNYAWMSVFYCLMQWKKITTEPNARDLLYRQLNKAAEKGLIPKNGISFLKDKVRTGRPDTRVPSKYSTLANNSDPHFKAPNNILSSHHVLLIS